MSLHSPNQNLEGGGGIKRERERREIREKRDREKVLKGVSDQYDLVLRPEHMIFHSPNQYLGRGRRGKREKKKKNEKKGRKKVVKRESDQYNLDL